MPRGDRTGPWGKGPMSGRGLGFCAGYATPGFANAGRGMGGGPRFGAGGGHGWRHQFYATGLPGWARSGYGPAWGAGPAGGVTNPGQETDYLQRQAASLKATLADIEERLAELEQRPQTEPS
jgi:hypothetical protein